MGVSCRELWNIFGITKAYFLKSIPKELLKKGSEEEV